MTYSLVMEDVHAFPPGKQVQFGKRSGSEVRIDGEELLILKESDVLGVQAA